MDTVIKNGTVVTASETYQADIAIREGRISLIWRDPEGDEIVDASRSYVFPGVVDRAAG